MFKLQLNINGQITTIFFYQVFFYNKLLYEHYKIAVGTLDKYL